MTTFEAFGVKLRTRSRSQFVLVRWNGRHGDDKRVLVSGYSDSKTIATDRTRRAMRASMGQRIDGGLVRHNFIDLSKFRAAS